MTQSAAAPKQIGCLMSLMWLVITIVPAFVLLTSRDSDLIARSVGGLFQLLGIGAVAFGIRDLRKTFDVPPWLDDLRNELTPLWTNAKLNISRWLRIKRNVNVFVGSGELKIRGNALLTGSAQVTPRLTLKWLAQELEKTQAEMRQLRNDIGNQRQELQTSISAEAAKREDMHTELKSIITSLAVGGLRVEAVGVVWLAVGTVLVTWPQEIANVFHR